jgi:hypothetical protein
MFIILEKEDIAKIWRNTTSIKNVGEEGNPTGIHS